MWTAETDQTGRMPIAMSIAGRTGHFVGCVTFVVVRLNYHYMI